MSFRHLEVQCIALALTLTLAWASRADAEQTGITVASWSFNHTRDVVQFWSKAEADVIALRDVLDLDHVAKVFPKSHYIIHTTSERYRVKTGFAVRKTLPFVAHMDVGSLGLEASVAPDLTPAADIGVYWKGLTIRFLSLQLYPGCTARNLHAAGPTCSLLRSQAAAVAGWVATRNNTLSDFVIVGDFTRVLSDDDGAWRIINMGDSAKLRRVPINLVWVCKEGWPAWRTEYTVVAARTLRLARRLNDNPPVHLDASKCPQMLSLLTR